MRKLLFIFLFIISSLNYSFSLTKDSLNIVFHQANEYYAKKDYKEAVLKYQAIADFGIHSFDLYYNLGNAYFKSDELGNALLYYHKAYKLSPNDKEVNFNIHFAERHTIDKIETPEEFFLLKWWKTVFLMFSLSTWTTLLYVCLFFASFGFIVYLLINQLLFKKIGFYSGSISLLLSVLFYIIGNAQYSYFNSTDAGIIHALSTTVRSAPINGEKLFILHEGTKVNILDEHDGAVNISLSNGKSGWVSKEDIREI